MQDDNRETETEIKKLSSWEKEEIFMMRWFTFIAISFIAIPTGWFFFHLNGYVGIIIFASVWIMPPLYYFRKDIGAWLKENIKYWWSMINGRIP